MKRILLIVVLLLSLKVSKETDSLKNKVLTIAKCFLDTKSNRDALTSVFEKLFTFKTVFEFIPLLGKLDPMIKECTGTSIFNLLPKLILKSGPKTAEVLKKIKNFQAPILLRKYLHDYISQNGLEYAKNECLSLVREKPFIQYNKICSLL